MSNIHVPACASLTDHIDAAVRETAGSFQSLGDFVIDVQRDWADEQLIADAGDEGVIRYWAAVEADWMRAMGVSQ